MRIEAVLFDMDGVIFNTEEVSFRVWKDAGEQFNLNLSDDVILRLMSSNFRDPTSEYGKVFDDMFFAEVINGWRHEKIIDEIRTGNFSIKKGVRKIRSFLFENQIPTALVTSSSKIKVDMLFSYKKELRPFSVVVSGDMVRARKPDPEPYLLAAHMLNVNLENCLVIEDSSGGILSASHAGALPVYIPDVVKLSEAALEKIYKKYDSLEDVIDLIRTFI